MKPDDFIPRASIAQDGRPSPVLPEAGHWGIRDFAALFDVTPRTIRFYEDKGLITPARASGARVFTVRDYIRVERILRGKRLGFSLEDIRDVFDVADGLVKSRSEIIRRNERFRKVIKSLDRRRHDIAQVTLEMKSMCQDMDRFIESTEDQGEHAQVFAHAAAYEAAFQTLSDEEHDAGDALRGLSAPAPMVSS